MVVLGGWAVSYERGTPVPSLRCAPLSNLATLAAVRTPKPPKLKGVYRESIALIDDSPSARVGQGWKVLLLFFITLKPRVERYKKVNEP